jgi:hypothetical protein
MKDEEKKEEENGHKEDGIKNCLCYAKVCKMTFCGSPDC